MNNTNSDIFSYAEPMHLNSTNIPDLNSITTWLTRSKILIENEAPVMSGGYGNFIDGLTGKSPMLYSEITGYAAQFWLRQAQPDSLSRAINAGECLLRLQEQKERIAGAFPYGLSRPDGKMIQAFFSFDAGICASAFIDLAWRTGEKRFKEGAELAGSFLNSMQNEDGSFSAVYLPTKGPDSPVMEEWFADGCVLHGKNTIALVKLWQLTGHEQWRKSACRTLDWICGIQGQRGDFPHRQGAPLSMTHTHCYATESLLYAGLALDNDRYLTAGIRGAEWLRTAQHRSGAFHRDYKTQGSGSPRASNRSIFHVGPVAQAVRLWWVASRVSPGRPWAEAAARSLGFLSKVQILDKNSIFYGSFPQSVRFFGIRPRRKNTHYSPWEAMFAYEAARLWTIGRDEPSSSIF